MQHAIGRTGIRFGTAVVSSFLIFTFYFLISPPTASAQRDYLTEAEIELIRDAQQIDERIDVLIHAIDRRFGVLQIDVSPAKKPRGEWGELPKGTRRELLYDIKRILIKAIDDIDNLSERPDSIVVNPEEKNKKPKGFTELFPRAVRKLDAAARRYQPALKAALEATKDPVEQGSLINTLEMCDQINAAVPKLPAEVKPKGKN